MVFFQPLLLGLGLAMLVAGIGWTIPCLLRRRDSDQPRGWGAAVPLAAGYLAGHVAVREWPPWPPAERIDWLFFLTVAALAVGVLDGLRRWSVAWRMLPWLLLWGAVLEMLLRPLMANSWDRYTSGAWLAALGATGLAFWLGLDVLADRARGASLPLALVVVAAGSALVAHLSGSALLAELAAVLLASLLTGVVAGWWCPGLSLARGGTTVVAVLLAGMWLLGYFYADVPTASAVLLAAAPAAWLGEIPFVRRLGPWQTLLLRTVAVAVPVAVAVALAWRASPPLMY